MPADNVPEDYYETGRACRWPRDDEDLAWLLDEGTSADHDTHMPWCPNGPQTMEDLAVMEALGLVEHVAELPEPLVVELHRLDASGMREALIAMFHHAQDQSIAVGPMLQRVHQEFLRHNHPICWARGDCT
jgi:hypothetical protein